MYFVSKAFETQNLQAATYSNLKRRWLLAMVMILCGFSLQAQVNMTVQITPPYDASLNELKDQITLTINGPSALSGELRMTFLRTTDEGVTVSTITNLGKMISLRDGTAVLTGADFDEMFMARRLEFIGVDANEALNGEGLPPGEYSLCFYLMGGGVSVPIGTACANFTVPEPTITINTNISSPYHQPFADLSEQVSVMLTASRGIHDGLLRMTVSGDNGINITTKGRGKPVQLEKNNPLTLTGSDLDALFAATNLDFSGISPGEANERGLPPGNYQICFRLWYNGEKNQTGNPPDGCSNFTIDPPVITINTTANPPYDQPFNALSDQVRVTLNAPIYIDDGFLTMQLQGNNGIVITTKQTAKDFLQIEQNEPLVLTGSELDFYFNPANLNFQGITAAEASESGLPPGEYTLCFRLWYDDNKPATDASAGCANFTIDRGVVTITTTLVPPYDVPFNSFGDQTTLTINTTTMIDDGFLSLRLTGNNGVQISSKSGAKDYLVLEKNTTTLTGSDLSFLFQATNLNYQGISASEVNETGLPPGNYELCFRLWYADNDPATDFVCSNFSIDRGVVTINTRIVPPYDVPLAELADQVTVSLNATKNINNAFLRLLIKGDNGVQISSKPAQKELIEVKGNDPQTLTGADLDFHFNAAHLDFQGISAQDASTKGLPPGEYELCFQLWYSDNDPATGTPPAGCTAPFTIEKGTVSINTTLTPPYDQSFQDLDNQTTVMLSATQDIDDGFLTLSLTGDNGIKINTKAGAKEFIQAEKSVPLTLTGGDLSFWFNPANLDFQGITTAEVNENGLPPGEYTLCFRLWYDDNEPATDASAGCTTFRIERGTITLVPVVTPPYDGPFNTFSAQSTLTITTTQTVRNAFLRLQLTGDNGIQISSKNSSKEVLNIAKNEPLALSGSDLDFLYDAANLDFQGITAAKANEDGLPPGNYELCFRLWYADNDPATDFQCVNFTISQGLVSLSTSLTPPYDQPFEELAGQATVIISSSQDIDDGFLTLSLEGDNGIIISTKTGAKEFIQAEQNVPLILSGDDLSFWFNPANLDFQGITAAEASEQGLPPGDYALCFRLWYDDNKPATGEGTGCNRFNVDRGMVALNTIVTSPYQVPLSEMAEQVAVNISTTRAISGGFLRLLITGDNGVEIATQPGAKSLIDIAKNEPLSLSGSDLDFYFNAANLSFTGTTATAVNEHGLPPGNYELCFRLWYNDNEPATGEAPLGCAAFTVGEGVFTINTVVTPPYNAPLEALFDQTSVTLTATTAVDDAYLTFDLRGDNGIHIRSSAEAVKELPQILPNEPLVITPHDYIGLNGNGVAFEGITYQEATEHGLPPGNYELCFRLWHDVNKPATDEGAGCAMFHVEQGVVSLNTVITPPYEVSFSELAEQLTINLLSTQRIENAYLTLLLETTDASFGVRSDVASVQDKYISLEANEMLTLSGTDLTYLLESSRLLFQGIDPAEISENGLPAGDYTLCFRLWYRNGEPATAESAGCVNFSIAPAIVSLNTVAIPPFNQPVSELPEQVNVTVNANRNLSDVFLRMRIEGDNGVQITTQPAAKELFDVEENVPLTLSGSDLALLFNTDHMMLQSVTTAQLNEIGLPPGTYDLCFQLWYNDAEPATDAMQGCYQFTIEPAHLTMAVQVIPPYTPLMEDVPSMTHLTLMASADMQLILNIHITGDNGIVIANRESFTPTEVITLEANTPLLLSDLDLSEYFATDALIFSGISQGVVLDHGLPEGNYQICFTALTPEGEPLKLPEACSNMFPVNYIEPPQIMTPECGAVISASEAQHLIFNWLPAIGAPANTAYTLKMVELLNPDQNPNDAMLSSTTPSFLEETVMGTSFFYSPAHPVLEPGRTYAFQVYIGEDISQGNYINQGASQVCHFTIAEEKDVVVMDEEELPAKEQVNITPIEKNPFQGYHFPVSQVSGTLHYTFKPVQPAQVNILANTQNNVQAIQPYAQVSSTSNSGNSNNMTGQSISTAKQGNITLGNSVDLKNMFVPVFNQPDINAEDSKPVRNVKVSLLQTYILYGQLNGQYVSGKILQDGDIKQNQSGFKSTVAPGWNQVVATTTTDENGNFSFTVIQFDSLGGAMDVDWSSTNGDLYATHMHIKGKLYKTYRLVVESPYYCSPDVNILVQPWEGVDLGKLVSYVRSYNLRVYTKKQYNSFYDYNFGNDPVLPNVETKLYREVPIGQVPVDEGQHAYDVPSGQVILQEKLVGEGKTNAQGYIEFKNLVRHNANNTLDQYQIVAETNDYVGIYNFQRKEVPYPVMPYNPNWDWKKDQIAMTFHLPTSQDYGYGIAPVYNSQFTIDTFEAILQMNPALPRIAGQVLSKQLEVTPKSVPNGITANSANGFFGGQTVQVQSQNYPSPGLGQGFNLTTNSSAVTLTNASFYLGALGLIDLENWSEKVNMAPIPKVPIRLLSVAAKDNKFTELTTVPTDANGQYRFEGLQVELNMDALSNENKLDDALWTSIIGPSRAVIANVPGFKSQARDLGILKWGDQRIINFELEPDGYVFGYVEDERGNPVKAEVFVDSLVSTTTVMSAEYQEILGIPMPLKEVFVLKAPSGSNRKLKIVPDNLVYVPGTFTVNIEKNQPAYQPQNLGGFKVASYKHRIRLRVTETLQYTGDLSSQPPVRNALVRVTNILSDSPDKNTKTSGEGTTSGVQFQFNMNNQSPQQNNSHNPNTQMQPLSGKIDVAQSASDMYQVTFGENTYGYTNASGYVELAFENNGHHFEIEIIPPADRDLVSKTISIYSESTGESVDHGTVELEPAFWISGKVTYGSEGLPLANAKVLVDQGGENIETRTDAQGNYTLTGIPRSQSQWSVSAENVDHPLTLVADTKTISHPFPQTVNFHLNVFDSFEVKELMGLPVTVTAIEEMDGKWLVTGAFINLPDNPNFRLKDAEARLKFYQVPVTIQQVQGKKVAVPVEPFITTDADHLDLINYTTFVAEQKPVEGNLLKVMADAQGRGYIPGKVDVLSTSFQFEEQYMSFNQSNASAGIQPVNNGQTGNAAYFQKNNTGPDDVLIVQDGLGKAYLQLFASNTSLRLYDPENHEQQITTLKADNYPVQRFGVTNAHDGDYTFKVQDFKAIARRQDSYVFKDSLVLATTLVTHNIPKIVPKQLEINVGEILVTRQGYEKIAGSEPIQFKLEEWEVICEEWELSQYATGIRAKKGTLKTSLFHTGMKDIRITPNDFDPGAVDLNSITFGGVVPVQLEISNLAFEMNPASTADNQPHWMLKVTGTEGKPGASISNLPGMVAGDKINIESFTIYSNDEKELNIGNQQQSLLFYDILHVSPSDFTVVEGGLEMTAMMDLNIPRLNKSIGGFRYVKKGNQIEAVFKGMEVNFEAQGKVKFTGIDEEGAQTLAPGSFDAKGKITDAEGIFLLGRLHRDKDSTYVIVEPLHQQLPIADDGSNKLIEITGDMEVVGSDWEYFVFSGDLYGMKGVEDAQKRKTFTVYGSINAEGEGMDIKNINADFAGIKMTYDIKHARLTGELEFDQNFSSVSISGKANLLADRDGWYLMASGAMEVPGFGNLKAGLGIGDYARISPDMQTTLLANAYDKTIPPSFQNGFSGFFFTGRKNIPEFSIPKTEFNFIVVSGALSGETGLDARLWMGFDDSGAEFGIGVMAYAYIDVALSGAITCTSVYGHVGAELGIKGMYNTGSGAFTLQGCGAITLAGRVEQCFGALGACCYDCCIATEGATALKVDMLIDSNGTFDASLDFGTCSGNAPGMGGNW